MTKQIKINTKEEARQRGMDIQLIISQSSLSYSELVQIQTDLYKLAKKFGLVREFKREGLI